MTTREYEYPNKSFYTGTWDDQNRRHGFGTLQMSDGTVYKGAFHEGFFHGLGILYFPEGARFEGEFKQGQFDGYGMFLGTDKTKFEGEFKDGKISGQGIVTFQDRSHGMPRNEGYFQGGTIKRREKCTRSIQRAKDVAEKARAQCKN